MMMAVGNYLHGPDLRETHELFMNAHLSSCLLLSK